MNAAFTVQQINPISQNHRLCRDFLSIGTLADQVESSFLRQPSTKYEALDTYNSTSWAENRGYNN